ncbi:MAG: succinate dehydrogenase iron-sulfur subunit [Bacteroidetes bacterium]|nr:succinate dehydrogenase iron-sulfur subunit [Bacteroidota bacterium]
METKTLKIFRFDPDEDGEPRLASYEVPLLREGFTVQEALFYILDNLDGSLSFRYSCRAEVCGSCAAIVNGSYRLVCGTRLNEFPGREIVVGPLPRLRVIKDLVVDMGPFFSKYEAVMPYLVNRSEPASDDQPAKERKQSRQQRRKIDEMIDCILCGACYSSCPSVWLGDEFLGPAALLKSYRFAADSRDEGGRQRLRAVDGQKGIWRCHTIFNCAEACPKKIVPTYSIQKLKGLTVLSRLGLR